MILDHDMSAVAPVATTCAPGRVSQLTHTARICVICLWRELPDLRVQVCWPCEERMARQLDLLGRVTRLLGVVARNEPTATGGLHIPIVDLTLPARGFVRLNQCDEQLGDVPIATWLMVWWRYYAGRVLDQADSWRVGRALLDELPEILAVGDQVAEFALSLRRAYGSARRALGRDLRPVRYTKPCPACGVHDALTRYPGDWIECGHCERLWDDPDMRQVDWGEFLWARQMVQPWAELDTAQAAMYAGVTVDVIWQWVHRNRLSPIRPALPRNPRFWALEVDRCTATAEHRARRLAARITKREKVSA